MLKKLLAPNYGELHWSRLFLFLLLTALFIRFPFFFRDYIDRDESTFILMGQAWVEGHLPYTKLWDLKPPVTFLFFAGIIKLFGKSFIAIRLFGTLLVAGTALMSYGIARRTSSQKASFWVALGTVVLLSLFGSLQGVMSEHISIFFFCWGCYLLMGKEHWARYLGVGLLFGLAAMSKLNLIDPILLLGPYLLWEGKAKGRFWARFKNLIFLGAGILAVTALTALPYGLQGELSLWWRSIFEAPMAYSEGKFHSPLNTLPLVLLVLGGLALAFWRKLLDRNSRELQILTVVILGILISFVQAGKINGHYLIHLHPFLLVPLGMILGRLPQIPKAYGRGVALLLLLVPVESYLEYANIISNKLEKGTFYNGEGIELPQYIKAQNLDTHNIYFTEYHIGYWVLGEDPPTKAATHPSNITRDELFPYMENPRKTGMEELRHIMEVLRPKTLVAREGKKIFDKKLVEYNAYIEDYLETHYRLEATLGRGLIYQRLE